MCQKNVVVGIFSKDHPSCYEWLIDFLFESAVVSDVHPIHISTTTQNFTDGIGQCKFAILYHAKQNGILNVTDVPDSLYDEELKTLSEKLGKDNVIVIIDGMEDNSDEKKNQILEKQPSIGTFAKDLMLFSTSKSDKYPIQSSKPTASGKKLQDLKNIIKRYNSKQKILKWLPWAMGAFLIIIAVLVGVGVWKATKEGYINQIPHHSVASMHG
ncbi:uncharacterized protein [Hyperolius riggenbachi]|uniref:uncharacterized protein n=1 Tax=Hyperolius riggenbachi TaxID=752182 RepID=UPI0035A3357A